MVKYSVNIDKALKKAKVKDPTKLTLRKLLAVKGLGPASIRIIAQIEERNNA